MLKPTGKLKALGIKLKRAEEEVQVARERLNYLLSTSPGVIYVCKPSGDYGAIFVSENVKRQLGYEAREFINDPGFWADRIHPEDKPGIFAGLSRLCEQNHHTHEYRFLHKDGTYRWMLDQLKLVRNKEGIPLEIVGFWADITERKHAEKALQTNEEELEAIYDNAPLIMLLVDENWTIRKTNAFTAQFVGVSVGYMLNRRCGEALHCVHALDVPEGCGFGPSCKKCAVRLIILNTIETGLSHREEEVKMSFSDRENEPEATFLISSKKLLIREQPFSLVSMQNITERKQAEQALIARQKELEAKTKEFEEINTALNFLLKKREKDKKKLEEKVLLNIRELIAPCLEKLKKSRMNESQNAWLNILESHLKNIISPVLHTLNSKHLHLTSSEIKILSLIDQGKTTKEIASLLNLASQTIESHRKNLRKKLGIRNNKITLRTHLKTLQ